MVAVADAPPARTFVPEQIDLADVTRLEPLYRTLLDRPVGTVDEVDALLADYSELTAAVDEVGSRRYIEVSRHTEDKAVEARFMAFVERVEPVVKPLNFELQRKVLSSPAVDAWAGGDKGRTLLLKKWRADVDLFRPENVAIETDVTRRVNDWEKINGAMTVEFDGRERTLPQLTKYGEQTDRGLRQRAWEAEKSRRLQDAETGQQVFDDLLGMRARIAANAGLANYRDVAWRAYKRFDYTPEQCLAFSDAIAGECVPLVRQFDVERKAALGLDTLRPWDGKVDVKGRPPLAPFGEGQTTRFVDLTKAIFDRLSPELGEQFESLRRNQNLDLESRKGKRPGGYQASLDEVKQPFIFMNAAGVQRDVEVLLHEGGHAFHYLAAKDLPLVFQRSAPMEFCEVASMAMELLGSEHFAAFYTSAEDVARARRAKFEDVIRFFPWMATIDSFQHWLYTHPDHTRDERTAQWLAILDRFGGGADWTGYEQFRRTSWQAQGHLFHAPFYYVEYGIAQLGALQLWMKAKEDPRRALANYRRALALGGTRPLPELFAAAEIEFDFSARTLRPLMAAVRDELAELPA